MRSGIDESKIQKESLVEVNEITQRKEVVVPYPVRGVRRNAYESESSMSRRLF